MCASISLYKINDLQRKGVYFMCSIAFGFNIIKRKSCNGCDHSAKREYATACIM